MSLMVEPVISVMVFPLMSSCLSSGVVFECGVFFSWPAKEGGGAVADRRAGRRRASEGGSLVLGSTSWGKKKVEATRCRRGRGQRRLLVSVYRR